MDAIDLEQEREEANAVDLEGLKFVIDERDGTKGAEYLCVFDDERTEWMPVPESMDALSAFKKYKAENPQKSGPETIQNLSEWVKSDFVDAE